MKIKLGQPAYVSRSLNFILRMIVETNTPGYTTTVGRCEFATTHNVYLVKVSALKSELLKELAK